MAVVSHVSPVLHIYELDTETKEEEKKPELVSATMDRDTVWCVSLPPFSDTTSLQLHHGHMLVVDMCCTLRSLIGDISEDVGCHYRTYELLFLLMAWDFGWGRSRPTRAVMWPSC
jgi:hypothetical protein